MFSHLFKKNQLERNILILGEPGCGKRSFLLHYKDGQIASQDLHLPEINNLIYKKKLDNKQVSLVFTLNETNEELIPSMKKSVSYDLIISLIDLSSDKAKEKIIHQANIIEDHFPGVKTIYVGTKQDKLVDSDLPDNMIACSAKTGSGFDQFEEILLKKLDLDHQLNETHRCGYGR
ncbi:Rab family GTPase [Legionella longbeachae]|uniref:Uncharacterized protein n=1 Tax=Legionella longbeachae serogroup 1 (strain NSW150) TaxID=661367 RepID=D3HK81_LEGLN|nr:GTPase domain-containing protein [Legionella longbeachae]VEE03362.1 Uncharacterised protein [Legionella oakridgensis]HBD7397639.1 GTPase domain-containing protein [Legionella pneumophila]ARB93742.1 hypothetical protein A6J40_16860 [Legionella longbeachae]ARM33118.1 GTPase domain-containing protein [Legionella longbeachae]EEZ94041.1 conserved hypothetical protein [Legionella longbeachae D-4968]